MKRNTLPAALAWLGLIVSPGHSPAAPETDASSSQSATTLSGRVQNAVTGQSLYNARVSVNDTDLVTFTNEAGVYLLRAVPVGDIVITVFYTGLDPQQVTLRVSPGQRAEQNVKLTSVSRYGSTDVVKLDTFVVASSRESDADALAINEKRFAPNIKNVLATDTFGNITENNVAEFMKFLPGVTVEFVDASPNTVSVRGLASNLTGVSIDGAPTAQAHSSGNNRAFEFKQVSLNNFSRIEVTKVPTPATAADSMGGSINMVSKSAFEKSRPEFSYRLFVSTNGSEVTLRRTPFPSDSRTFKTLPGAEFTYSLPVSSKFGVVVTGSTSSQYNIQSGVRTTYNGNLAGTGATFPKPYLQQFQMVDAPKYRFHNSVSAKADWRVSEHGVLSFGGQVGFFMDVNRNVTFTVSPGTTGTPTPATGTSLSFGDDFVIGATGRGAVSQSQGFHNTSGKLRAANLRYRFDDGKWRIDMGGSLSNSKSWNRPGNYGYFSNAAVTLTDPVRVTINGFQDFDIRSAQAFDNNNREVDIYDIRNFRITTGTLTALDVIDEMKTAEVNARRDIGLFSFPAALQVGSAYRLQTRDRTTSSATLTYNGVNGDVSATRYVSTVYSSGPRRGLKDIPWVSSHQVYDAWKANPNLFTKTPAQLAAEENVWLNSSQYLKEAVSAHYAQAELRLFKSRLLVLGGVRFEETLDKGKGPLTDPNAVFVRNADGSFAHNAAGQRIRKPEAGAAGSLEEVRLTRKERGDAARKTYNDFYPSLHLTGTIRENFLLRAAYAETYGRPNLNEILPTTNIASFSTRATRSKPESRRLSRVTPRSHRLNACVEADFRTGSNLPAELR